MARTIEREALLNSFQQELDTGSAAVFIGAGLSRPAGFVNWKELMAGVAEELKLDVNRETDLIAVAQWHKNSRKGRHQLNQLLVLEFTKDAKPTENHRLLASLPIPTVWTTNYDHLIEEAFNQAHKRVDVKKRGEDLSHNKPRCSTVIYKMHGDVDSPDEAVLTKEDYAAFESKRSLFSTQLRGHLVSSSFLFLGYSFSDPNIDYVLSRIRSLLGTNKRDHYCIMRNVVKEDGMNDAEVAYQKRRLELRIDDLQEYGIQTHLVDQYTEVTEILWELTRRAVRKNVFVSGSADDFGHLGKEGLENFARNIGKSLIEADYNLISGLGLGVGGAVTIGALEALYLSQASQLDERTILRPFPQVKPSQGDLKDIWERYRQEMLAKAGVAIFIAGNKRDADGNIAPADGVRREFEIATEKGAFPIPIGGTGHMAQQLSEVVLRDTRKYFREHAEKVVPELKKLADASATTDEWIEAIKKILRVVAPK